jgi:hypothetical protein
MIIAGITAHKVAVRYQSGGKAFPIKMAVTRTAISIGRR